MCIVCEHELYEEHRNAEAGAFDPCPQCGKFPSNDGGPCLSLFQHREYGRRMPGMLRPAMD